MTILLNLHTLKEVHSLNIESGSSQGKTSAVHADLIPLNPDITFYMSVGGLTIIGIQGGTQ